MKRPTLWEIVKTALYIGTVGYGGPAILALMKKVIVLITLGLLIATNSWALVVTGSGQTKEETLNNCLWESVEMYTGTLVYGVTDVENYTLQKDQIVTASLGYVKKYLII